MNGCRELLVKILPCLSYCCFLMVRWLFCTHTHPLVPLRTHSVSPKVQALFFPSAENFFESCKWKVNAKTCYNYLRTARISTRELGFQGSSQIGCFSSEWTVRVEYPVIPGPLLTQKSLTCDFSRMHTTDIKLRRLNWLWLVFTTVELFSVLSVIGQ